VDGLGAPVVLGERLDLLLANGQVGEACELVAASFADRQDAGDLPEIAALVSAFPDDVLAAHPRALLELARACEADARVRLRFRLLDRAERLSGEGAFFGADSSGLKLALRAERIADLARDSQADTTETRSKELMVDIEESLGGPDSELVQEALARMLYAWGSVLAWRGDAASATAAEAHLLRSAGAARALGRTQWRAQALQSLGYAVLFERGEEERAELRMREAIALLPLGHPRRAISMTFLAEAFVRSHRGGDAPLILDEVRAEASLTGDQRALGYAAWIMAILTAEQGEAAETMEWLAEAERHPGDWFDHSTGIEFLAEAAASAERVGEIAAADAYLAQAQGRAEAAGRGEIVWFARGMIAARRGEPANAIKDLTRRLDAEYLPPREAWVTWLYLALARLRAGDRVGASQDAARGFAAAAALVGPGRATSSVAQLPEVITRLEPDLSRRLAPLAAMAGSATAARVQPASPRVRLFGGLSVRVGGQPVVVPEGRPALLVMLVAISDGPIQVDFVVEALWPEVPADVGRRRLRNVLTRVKVATGALIVRSGESLSLSEGTTVDLAEFDAAYARVGRALPSARLSLARAALALYGGRLLPEAACDPRVSVRQDRISLQVAELLWLLADEAHRAGEVDTVLGLWTRLHEVDPYDQRPVQRAIELLTALGREVAAERWRQRLDPDE
jgi:DNA-binding SARP family transcriptional activator